MQKICLGADEIAAAGLGCMAMSGGYGVPDERESIATIHAAPDAGLSLIETGDFYGMGHNEMLIAAALTGGRRQRAFISVKFGVLRAPDSTWLGYDLHPAAVKNFLAYSLRRLKTDYIDLHQPARYTISCRSRTRLARHRRSRQGRLCAQYRAVGSFRPHVAARTRHPSGRRVANRLFADEPRHRA